MNLYKVTICDWVMEKAFYVEAEDEGAAYHAAKEYYPMKKRLSTIEHIGHLVSTRIYEEV